MDEDNQKLQSQLEDMNRVVLKQQDEINIHYNNHEMAAAKFAKQISTLEEKLRQKVSEMESLQEANFREREELKMKHEQQLHELHEHSTSEIVKFRDDISTSLSTQQKVLSEKHVAELEKVKNDERIQLEDEWMAKLVALEEALRFKEEELRASMLREKEEEVAQVKEDWGAVLSEQLDAREEQHSLEMKKISLEMTSAKEVEIRLLVEKHDAEKLELEEKAQLHMLRIKEETRSLEEMYTKRIEDLEVSYKQEIQEIRAGQFNVLKETESSYTEEIAQLRNALSSCEVKHQQDIAEITERFELENSALKAENEKELENALETYRNELDKLNKTLVASKIEEKLTLTKKHDESMSLLSSSLESQYTEKLKVALLDAEKKAAAALADAKREIESDWREKFRILEEENVYNLQEELRKQRDEVFSEKKIEIEDMLRKVKDEFRDSQNDRDKAKKLEYERELKHIRDAFEAEMNQLREQHKLDLEQHRKLNEESLSTQERQLKELHNIELKGRLKEKDDKHELHLAAELKELRNRLEEISDLHSKSAADEHEIALEQLARKHKDDLAFQETMLNKTHDTKLQQAVQEVRQLLAGIHENEVQTLKEQHRLQIDKLQSGLDDLLEKRVADARVEYEKKMQFVVESKLKEADEEREKSLDDVEARHRREIMAIKKSCGEDYSSRLEEMRTELANQHDQMVKIKLEEQRLELSAQHLDSIDLMQREFHNKIKAIRREEDDSRMKSLSELEQRLRIEAAKSLEAERNKAEHAASNLRLQIELKQLEYEKMTQKHIEDMQQVKVTMSSDHESRLKEITDQNSRQMAELRATLKSEMESSLQSQKEVMLSEKEHALATLRHEVESQHNSLLSELSILMEEKNELEKTKVLVESMRKSHQLELEELTRGHTEAKSELIRSYEAKIDQMRDDYARMLDETKRNAELAAEAATRNLLHDQKVEMLEAQSAKVKSLKEDLYAEHMRQLDVLRSEQMDQLNKAIKNTELEVQSRCNKRVDELKSQWQLERENAESALRTHYKDEISLLRTEYNRFLEESKQNVTLASEMAMKNSLQAQRAEMLEAHSQSLTELKENMTKEFSEKVSRIEKDHDEKLLRLKAEHDLSLTEARNMQEVSYELKLEHALQLQKMELEEEQKLSLTKLAADLNKESDAQKQEAKEALEALQNNFRVTLENSKTEAEQEFQKMLEDSLLEQEIKLNDEHSKKIASAKGNFDEEIAMLRSEYGMFLEESKKNHEASAKLQLEKALESQKKELEASHLAAMDVLRSTLVAQHAREVAEVHEEHELYIEQQGQQAEKEYQMRLDEQLTSLKEHMAREIDRANEEARLDYAMKYEKDIKLIKEESVQQVTKDIEDRVLMETNKLSREHEREMSARCEELKRETEEKVLHAHVQLEEYKQKYESHKRFFDDEKALIEARYIEAQSALKVTHVRELEELKESVTAEYNAVMTEQKKEMDELRKELTAADERYEYTVNSLQKSLNEQAEFLVQKDSRIDELSFELQEAKAHQNDVMSSSLQDRMEVMTKEHQLALEAAHLKHSIEVENLKHEHKDALENMTLRLEETTLSEAKLRNSVAEMQRKYDDEFELRNAKEDELRTIRDEARNDAREAAELLTKLRTEHKEILDDLTKQHAAELVSIKKQFDESVRKFNEDADSLRAKSREYSECRARDMEKMEIEYQEKLDEQMGKLRSEVETQTKSEQANFTSQLEDIMIQLQQEKSSNASYLSELQALRDANELEMRKIREAGREEISRMQNMHFDEITSLRIQTQRELSESQEKIRSILEEMRNKDEVIDSITQEQLRLQGSKSVEQIQSQKEYMEVKEKLQLELAISKEKDEKITTLLEEKQRLSDVIANMKVEHDAILISKEAEVKYVSQINSCNGEIEMLKKKLMSNEERMAEEITMKDESFSKLKNDSEICIDALEVKVGLLSDQNSNAEVRIQELRDNLTAERLKNEELQAKIDALSSRRNSNEGKVDGGEFQTVQDDLIRVRAELISSRTELAQLKKQREELLSKNSILEEQMQDLERKLADNRDNVHESKEDEESRHVALMSDLKMTYDEEISQLKKQFQQKLSDQREEIQSGYLALLQKQMDNFSGLVNAHENASLPKLEGEKR